MAADPSTVVEERIKADIEDHIRRIQKAIRQPTLSVDGVGLRETAELTVEFLQELECDEAELIETEGAPGVWGYLDADAEKTLVTYEMLDTRLVTDEHMWDHPPFGAERVDMEPYGEVIVGRMGDKAAFVTYLNSLMAAREALDELPVNVIFLMETEEINGSPYYYEMLDLYEDRIADADACLTPAPAQNACGDVSISLGYKSAIYFDLRVSGDRWGRGPQGASIHSMSNSVVDSPAWRLVEALSCLTDDGGTEVLVDGFYDQYEPPTEDERKEIRDLIERLGGGADLWKSLPGLSSGRIERLTNNLQEDVEEAFVRYTYGPESFNIQGINCGFLGPNTGTHPFQLPHEGYATLDVRLPRGYDPDTTLRQIRNHLDAYGYEDVELDVRATHSSCQTDRDADIVKIVDDVLSYYGAGVTYWPYSSGGVPWAAFNSRYDMPVLHRVGVGHQGTADPDEFLVIDGNETVAGLADCEISYFNMLQEFAKIK